MDESPIHRRSIVIAGHLALDVPTGECRLGGTAWYGARALEREGFASVVLTGCSDALVERAARELPQSRILWHSSRSSTTFEQTFDGDGRRKERVVARAPAIDLRAFTGAWMQSRYLWCAPVLQEVEPEAVQLFAQARLRFATLQGWLRQCDASGQVRPFWEPGFERRLSGYDVAVLSDEDLEGLEALPQIRAAVPVVVLTLGSGGAWLFERGKETRVNGTALEGVADATGAGDVFAACLFASLMRGEPPRVAAAQADRKAREYLQSHRRLDRIAPFGEAAPQPSGAWHESA